MSSTPDDSLRNSSNDQSAWEGILPISSGRFEPTPVIQISDLRQWTYCPRVVWWTRVCPVGKVESFKMKLGLAKEKRLQQLQKRRTLKAFGLKTGQIESNVALDSRHLGMTGKLDLLISSQGCYYPVEVKFTQGPARLNHQIQLAGYALMLESIFRKPVPYGFIVRLPDETVDRVPVTGQLRELTWRTLQAIRLTIRTERMPEPVGSYARCRDCEYQRFCGDVGEIIATAH